MEELMARYRVAQDAKNAAWRAYANWMPGGAMSRKEASERYEAAVAERERIVAEIGERTVNNWSPNQPLW